MVIKGSEIWETCPVRETIYLKREGNEEAGPARYGERTYLR